jgi:hypothetical protein
MDVPARSYKRLLLVVQRRRQRRKVPPTLHGGEAVGAQRRAMRIASMGLLSNSSDRQDP